MSKKVLLIGGAGYVGVPMASHLLSLGFEVVCLDLFLYGHNLSVLPLLSNKNFQLVYGDLRNSEDLDRALLGVSDVVVLAGLVGDPITKKYPRLAQLINGEGIVNCLQCLNQRGLDKVIFISTCSNYGLMDLGEVANEKSQLTPLSLYAKSKVAVEMFLLSQKGKVDYSPVILRFATAFGLAPRMRFDLTVNEFTLDLAQKKDLLVFDAHTWRPYCHVKDFARLIENVLDASSKTVQFEVFNAGGNKNNYTKQSIVHAIEKVIPDSNIKYQERGADPRNYRVDFSKVKSTLGFEPLYSVDDGVSELLDAIRQGVFENVGAMKNFHGNYSILESKF